jgi:hypothetical protein
MKNFLRATIILFLLSITGIAQKTVAAKDGPVPGCSAGYPCSASFSR